MDFPVEHLSASSINKFLRCPRTWQEEYVFGVEGVGSSSLVIGSFTHRCLAEALLSKPLDYKKFWEETEAQYPTIEWDKETPASSFAQGKQYVETYMRVVGQYLIGSVVATEQEIEIYIPGMEIPVIGFVDIELENLIIDVKTTRYFNRKVSLNPEWKLQANIYQLAFPKPAAFHVLTRNKTDPIAVPGHRNPDLLVNPPDHADTAAFVQGVFGVMQDYWERFGRDKEYPGNRIHPWAGKYCGVSNCCQRR